MKNLNIITGLLFFLLVTSVYGQAIQEDKIPMAPKENRRPINFQPFNYKYSLEELKDNFSYDLMQLAKQRYERVKEVNQKGKWKSTLKSINSHRTPEWFEDAKFGMFIDWGLWSHRHPGQKIRHGPYRGHHGEDQEIGHRYGHRSTHKEGKGHIVQRRPRQLQGIRHRQRSGTPCLEGRDKAARKVRGLPHTARELHAQQGQEMAGRNILGRCHPSTSRAT